MAEQVYPEPTVGVLIFNDEGKLLLVKTFKWFDKWSIPGGHVELGETLKDAVKREIKEEVGLDVEILDSLTVQEAIYSPEFWKKKHFLFLDFIAKCKNDRVIVDADEIQSYIWVDPKKTVEMDLESFTRKRVEEYLKKYPNGFS